MFRSTVLLLLFATTAALASSKTVTLELYNDKGLMGTQVTEIADPQSINSSTTLAWNNRRVSMMESYKTNKQGYPVAISVKGVSAFGAMVDESFSLNDGVAKWTSRADDGEERLKDNKFYITVDGLNRDMLVRLLLKTPFNQAELLPSGKVQLKELTRKDLEQNGVKQTVILHALQGLNFNPEFIWTDQDGYIFSMGNGFIKGIRQGWGMETYTLLEKDLKLAEEQYYKQLTLELTKTLDYPILISQANVVDVINNTVNTNQDILIIDGKINAVGNNLSLPEKYKAIDAKDHWVVPGLWDMHGHLSKTDGFNYIANGVTSVRDIGNSPNNMEEIEKLFDNDLMGTRIYKSGFIDKKSEYSGGIGFTVDSIEEAKKAIDWYADNGYIQIKTYSSMDPTWVKQLATYIHSKNMRLSGHIPAFMSAEQAVDAGFDEIQHINMLFLNFFGGDQLDTRKQLRFSLFGEKASELDLSSKPVQTFIKKLSDKNIEVDLTVSTFRSLLLKRNKQTDIEYVDIADHLPPLFQRGLKTATMNIADEATDKAYNAAGDAMLKMTKALFDAGVPIIPGTDYFSGFTLLRELELYELAGIPAIDVIKIATINSAKVVGNDAKTGSIESGKDADMIILKNNPLESIKHLRSARLVVKGNKLYQPDKIHCALGVTAFEKSIKL